MSTLPRTDGEVDLDELGVTALRVAFGDRTGATIFLVGMVFYALYWRVGIFSSDTYAIANTLVAVAEGHLHVDRVVYGPSSIATPGLHEIDGRLYGRNYGHVFAALPILLALRGLSLFVDVRILFLGSWCLGLAWIACRAGAYVDRPRWGTRVGIGAGLVLLVLGAALGRPLSPRWFPVAALQLATMGAAALVGVTSYRLVRRRSTSRLGVAAGLAVVLATPVGFWASIPKRHSVTALLALLVLYSLYRSREAPTVDGETRFRALAYAWVGLLAWVHAAHALVLLVALGTVDVPTARSNRPRSLAVIGVVFLLSVLPALLTNAAISGDPLRPPRMLPAANDGEVAAIAADGGMGSTSGTDGAVAHALPGDDGGGTGDRVDARGGSGTAGLPAAMIGTLLGVLEGVPGVAPTLVARLERLVDFLSGSLAAIDDPKRLSALFVRSGYVAELPAYNDRAINLSVLESLPIGGAVLGVPFVAWRRHRSRDTSTGRPAGTVDAVAVVYLLLLVGLYFGSLPTHHMFTVRYLHPLYPIAIYGLCRTGPVRRVVRTRWSLLVRSYGVGVAVGVPAYVTALAATDAVLSEAVQLYAIVALSIAGAVGGWAIASAITDRYARAGAIVLGVAAAATTTYLLVSGVALFAFTDNFALATSRALAEALRFVNPWRSLW